MRDHVTEDRISAYLDGELSLDERQLVEQQLAESEDLRGLFEDLQRVRSRLQALPKLKLPNDFALQVVQQIQQSAVTPTAAATVEPAHRTRHSSRWRSVAVMLTSIAAVVVIAFSLPMGSRPPIPGPSGGGETAVATPVFLREQPQLLMVYDVTISPAGAEGNRFIDVLKRAGVGFGPNMKLDGKLESDVIALRESGLPVPGDVAAVPYKKGRSATIVPERVEMVYLTGGARTIDKIGRELKKLATQRNEIRRMQFDLILEPRQVAVLRRLHESARLRFAQSGGLGGSDLGVAFGLEFGIQLTSVNVPEVASFAVPRLDIQVAPTKALENGDLASDVRPPPSHQESTENHVDLSAGVGTPTGDDEPSAVLVILRYPSL